MTYIVTKIIKGNPYLYEVRSERDGDRVRQVFVRYLGRADRAGAMERQAVVPEAVSVAPETLMVEPEQVMPEVSPEVTFLEQNPDEQLTFRRTTATKKDNIIVENSDDTSRGKYKLTVVDTVDNDIKAVEYFDDLTGSIKENFGKSGSVELITGVAPATPEAVEPEASTPEVKPEKLEINLPPILKDDVQTWFLQLPQPIQAQIRKIEYVDDPSKLRLGHGSASYHHETGVITLSSIGKSRHNFLHEVGHTVMENAMDNGDFSPLQEFMQKYESSEQPALNVKQLYNETSKKFPKWNNSEISEYLYTANKEYRDWSEAFANEFIFKVPQSITPEVTPTEAIPKVSTQMAKFLEWVEKDGLVTPREFRIGRGFKVRQDAILRGFVVLKGNRHALTGEGIKQLLKPPAVKPTPIPTPTAPEKGVTPVKEVELIEPTTLKITPEVTPLKVIKGETEKEYIERNLTGIGAQRKGNRELLKIEYRERTRGTRWNPVTKQVESSPKYQPELSTPEVTSPSAEPEVKEPWEMTRREYRISEYAPKVDAIQQAISEGKPIILTTHLRATQLTKPEHIRLSGSTVEIPQGRKWIALTDDQVQSLSGQAGIKPVPFEERVYHHAEVEKAISEGKIVSPEVLKDYPELAKPSPEAITPPTEDEAPEPISPTEVLINTEASAEALPRVGDTVSGLVVRKDIPNQESIESTLDDWEVLPGIREIPTSNIGDIAQPKFYSVEQEETTRELAEQIKESGEINPLIVVVEDTGDYILEGSHRLDALRLLGIKSFPAQVVINRESLPIVPEAASVTDDAKEYKQDKVIYSKFIKQDYDPHGSELGKPAKVRRVHVGEVDGKPAWADGFMMELNAVPEKIKASKGYKEITTTSPTKFSSLIPDYGKDGREVKPLLVDPIDEELAPVDQLEKVYLSNMGELKIGEEEKRAFADKKYIDYFIGQYPDAKFIVKSISSPIVVQSKSEIVGVVMPVFAEPHIPEFSALAKKLYAPASPEGVGDNGEEG